MIFYLIYKGCEFNITDINGCGLVHWGAFQNNLYLIKVLASLGLQLNKIDSHGLTPFSRALYN